MKQIKYFNNFATGFITSIVIRNSNVILNKCLEIFNIFSKKEKKNNENIIYILCKIKDKDIFNYYFPEIKGNRVQPGWLYFEEKGVIKIKVDYNLEHEITTYAELLSNTDIDTEFFEEFCDIFIYINYFTNNKEYINIYQKDSIIDIFDFLEHETELSKKHNSLICATLQVDEKNEYITKYFKMYLNNKIPINLNLMLLNYDKINTLDAKLQLVYGKCINIFNINDQI